MKYTNKDKKFLHILDWGEKDKRKKEKKKPNLYLGNV